VPRYGESESEEGSESEDGEEDADEEEDEDAMLARMMGHARTKKPIPAVGGCTSRSQPADPRA
jgi:hypothetical protein